jgi:TolA-binding protein
VIKNKINIYKNKQQFDKFIKKYPRLFKHRDKVLNNLYQYSIKQCNGEAFQAFNQVAIKNKINIYKNKQQFDKFIKKYPRLFKHRDKK